MSEGTIKKSVEKYGELKLRFGASKDKVKLDDLYFKADQALQEIQAKLDRIWEIYIKWDIYQDSYLMPKFMDMRLELHNLLGVKKNEQANKTEKTNTGETP